MSKTQTEKLTRLTKAWKLPETKITALLSYTILWAGFPELFWEGGGWGDNIFRHYLSDLWQLKEIDPLKRRLILIFLSECVEVRRKKMLDTGKRSRSRAKLKQQVSQPKPMLLSTLHSIVQEAWPDASIKQAEIKSVLARHSHYGWK